MVQQLQPRPEESFYKQLLDNLYDAVYFVTTDRQITYWNQAAEQLTGFTASEVIGTHCAEKLKHVNENGCGMCKQHCPLAAVISEAAPHEVEVFLLHKDGHRIPVLVRATPITDANGNIVGAVEIFSDNTRHRQTERRLSKLHEVAFRDALTGIYNRHHLDTALARALDDARQYGAGLGLLLIDVDDFKSINDNYGHDCGDMVLTTISKTLASSLRDSDILGRWGGDEFMAILPGATTATLSMLTERSRKLVEHSPVSTPHGEIAVTISLGGAIATENETPETLLRRADQRLYRSKREGRNRAITSDSAGFHGAPYADSAD